MRLPKVVIVGRPNVGKSSLFNRIVGRKAAVVADREGVTRDRHYQTADWNGVFFQVIDTGGFLARELDALDTQVRRQIDAALDEADCILFLADGRTGITDLDQQFARIVLRQGSPVLLAVNKSESQHVQNDVHQFWNLGLGKPHAISALTGMGVADLLDAAVGLFPERPGRSPDGDSRVRVAILGRPNAGKSTLVNRLVGEDRLITSEVAGTTRDAIDTEIEFEGRPVILTDTAGLRKKARVKDEVEYFSNLRTLESIRRSDICVLLSDVGRGLEIQDLRIIRQVEEAGKGLVLGLNKWDTLAPDDKTFDHLVKDMVSAYPELEWVPVVAVSGLTGRRLPRLMEIVLRVHRDLRRILGRENVIRFFEEAVAKHPHPSTTQGAVSITRCCQVLVNPPALAFEVSRPDLVSESYTRYLRRQVHEYFGLEGVPVRIWLRKRFQLRTDEELRRFLARGAPAGEEWPEAAGDGGELKHA